MRALVLTCSLAALTASAQDVPPKVGVLVLLKVLTYDAGFEARGQGDFVVLVAFSKGNEGPANALLAELNGLEIKSIKQRKLVFRTAPDSERLAGDAVLLSSALAPDARRQVLEAARVAKLYSLALSEAEVNEGALLGVVSASGKLQPVINATTARQLGVEFSASVLKVARTVNTR